MTSRFLLFVSYLCIGNLFFFCETYSVSNWPLWSLDPADPKATPVSSYELTQEIRTQLPKHIDNNNKQALKEFSSFWDKRTGNGTIKYGFAQNVIVEIYKDYKTQKNERAVSFMAPLMIKKGWLVYENSFYILGKYAIYTDLHIRDIALWELQVLCNNPKIISRYYEAIMDGSAEIALKHIPPTLKNKIIQSMIRYHSSECMHVDGGMECIQAVANRTVENALKTMPAEHKNKIIQSIIQHHTDERIQADDGIACLQAVQAVVQNIQSRKFSIESDLARLECSIEEGKTKKLQDLKNTKEIDKPTNDIKAPINNEVLTTTSPDSGNVTPEVINVSSSEAPTAQETST